MALRKSLLNNEILLQRQISPPHHVIPIRLGGEGSLKKLTVGLALPTRQYKSEAGREIEPILRWVLSMQTLSLHLRRPIVI